MHGGSRHGSRGQAHSGPRGKAARPADARGAGSADVGARAAGSREARARAAASAPAGLPDADRLTRLLEPVIRAMGMDLEGVRVTAAGRRRLLRVTIDADGGVSLDAIALASRELSARLDGSPVMGELPYTLEVSSPGVDRPLTQPRHWRRAIGRLVVVPLTGQQGHHAGNGLAPLTARVAAASEQGVTLDCDGVLREYRYAELGPGRVQVEFGAPQAGEDEAGEELADELDDPDAGEED
ncbi:MAG TPA: ribosome maturation factor RimP [Streptosporangiaceae bacterium]|nr:ribosome maturation factor RimP [Streptosporangiaceae bacterium]